jgi:hypothetical protein
MRRWRELDGSGILVYYFLPLDGAYWGVRFIAYYFDYSGNVIARAIMDISHGYGDNEGHKLQRA